MPATVTGKVYGDSNCNGQYDPGEPGIANVFVMLSGPGGYSTAQTDSNGEFTYLISESGDYVLYEPVSAPESCPPALAAQPSGYALSNGPRKREFPITDRQIAENAVIDRQDFGHKESPAEGKNASETPAKASADPDIQKSPSAVGTSRPSADLSIRKLASPDPVSAGQTLTYSLDIANLGPSSASQVVVTDAIPSVLLNPEFSLDNGTSWKPWVSPYRLGNLANQAARVILIRGTVQVSENQTISNTASISSATPDPNSSNNTSTAVVNAQASADLSVVKTASPSPAQIGKTLTYTVTVSNAGPSNAQNVTLTDTPPDSLEQVQFSIDGGKTFYPWVSPYTIGTLKKGASISLLIRGVLSSSAPSSIINTASVSSPTPDPNPGDNTVNLETEVTGSADLSVSKTVSPNPAAPGQTLTYTITVKNLGPGAASAVSVSDPIPGELSHPEFSVDNGATWKPWVSPYQLGDLTNQAARTILIRGAVQASQNQSISNTVSVSSSTPDPNPNNNTASITSEIAKESDLSVSKTAWPNPAVPGQTVIYTITVANHGPFDANSVLLSDQTFDLLSQVEYSVNHGQSWTNWTGNVSLGTLAAGSSVTIFLRGILSANASGTISNTAKVSSSSTDPNPDNNQVNVVTPILDAADLSVAKTASPDPAVPGQPLTYTLTISNAGPSAARHVKLSDAAANGSYSLDQGASWQDWEGSYPLGDIAPGQKETVLIRVPVAFFDSSPIINTAMVSADTYDPIPGNNRATITIPKLPYAQLGICKCACQGVATPGQYLSYSVTISNAGPGEAQNVVLTDQIPCQLKNVQYSTDGGATWSPWESTYSLGTLAAGARVTVWIAGVVNAFSSGSITNTATVSSDTPDPGGSVHSSTVITCIIPPRGWSQCPPYQNFPNQYF